MPRLSLIRAALVSSAILPLFLGSAVGCNQWENSSNIGGEEGDVGGGDDEHGSDDGEENDGGSGGDGGNGGADETGDNGDSDNGGGGGTGDGDDAGGDTGSAGGGSSDTAETAGTSEATGSGEADDGRPELGDTNDQGQTLVWAEEFDGPEIDRSIWGFEHGLVRNNEEQYYTDGPENAFIEGGKLVIRAIPEAYRGGNYTSASLITENNAYWVYGCIEARIKIPDAPGCWPAFWLMPQDKVYGNTPPYDCWWPANGEIDIMESVSQTPYTVFGTAHFLDGDQHHYDVSSHVLAEPLASDYHVFKIQWSETSIEWYVDDIHYHSFDISQPIDGRRPFAETFYIVLNLAVGGKWPEDPDPAQYPEEMLVDWVRVWQFL